MKVLTFKQHLSQALPFLEHICYNLVVIVAKFDLGNYSIMLKYRELGYIMDNMDYLSWIVR